MRMAIHRLAFMDLPLLATQDTRLAITPRLIRHMVHILKEQERCTQRLEQRMNVPEVEAEAATLTAVAIATAAVQADGAPAAERAGVDEGLRADAGRPADAAAEAELEHPASLGRPRRSDCGSAFAEAARSVAVM